MTCGKVVQRIGYGGLKACGRFVQYCGFYVHGGGCKVEMHLS
jgi:hypothetical protein